MSRKKNKSSKIPDGRTLQTRDEYFEGQGNYRKPNHGYGKSGKYRRVVVVDSNSDDELAVVQLTSSDNAKQIKGYEHGKYKYRPFVKIADDRGKPIKVGHRFEENLPARNMSKKDVTSIKKDCFASPKVAKENIKKVRKLKKRKK